MTMGIEPPPMPLEMVKEIWLKLHETLHADDAGSKCALAPEEVDLYWRLTRRLLLESSIARVEIEEPR